MYVSIITILLTVEDGLVSFTNKCEQASYQKIKMFLQISNNAYRETNFKFICTVSLIHIPTLSMCRLVD